MERRLGRLAFAPARLLAAFVLLFSWLPLHIRLGSLDYVNYGFVHAGVPSPRPTLNPTPVPTVVPTRLPSPEPSPQPTTLPTVKPTAVPTSPPTFSPTYLPGAPTLTPSPRPTARPTISPTRTSQPTNPGLPGDPQVVSWTLSLATGQVTIQFNQVVNPATFRISRVSIIPARQASYPFNSAVYLTGYVASSFMNADIEAPSNGTTGYGGIFTPQPVSFFMSSDDYAAMMYNPLTANDRASSYLVIRQGAIQSYAGRPNKELNQSSALQVSQFTADTLNPFVTAAGIDYDKGFVTLNFSVPIGGSSGLGQLTMAGLTIQSAARCAEFGASAVYDCKGAIVFVSTPDSYQLNVTSYARVITYFIGAANLNAIKRVRGIADNVQNTYFSATHSIANDTKGNPMDKFVTGFNLNAGLQASFFLPDVTPPRLVSWDYDTASGGITLRFNEPVDPDYFNYSSAVIVSKAAAWTGVGTHIVFSSITNDILNKQTALSENLVIQLSPSKFAEVIATTDILVSTSTSFLVLYPNAVTDTALNWYQGLDAPPTKPIQVLRYLPDTVRPLVLAAALDMTLRTLTMTFTKIMILSSFNPSELTFQSQAMPVNAESLSVGPTSLVLLSLKDSNVVVMSLSDDLFDSMKHMAHLGHSQTSTYIYLTGKFLTDKTPSLNRVVDILPSAAMMVTAYIPDNAPPLLLSWYADMGLNLLSLVFSEPVDIIKQEFSQQTLISAIDPTAITLWDDAVITAASVSYRLSELTKVSSYQGHTVVLQLDDGDSASIKTRTPLCVVRERCFASVAANLARDVVTYDAAGVAVRNALVPVTLLGSSPAFIVDNVPPLLLSYTLFMSFQGFGTLTLYFDEPVQGQNILMRGIGLHTAASYDSVSTQLSESSYSDDSNSLTITITLSSFDFLQLKQAGIASSQGSVFLTIDPSTVTDIAGNAVGGILGQTSPFLRPSGWYPDDFPPSIVTLALDKSMQNLTVFFNDAVRPSKVNLARFVLFSSGTGNKMSLPNALVLSKSNTAALVLNLAPMLAQINSLGLLASQDDANLYIDQLGAVEDVPAQNQLAKMSISQGVRMGQTFTGFKLDLTRGKFYIFTAYPYDVKSVWDPTLTSLASVAGGNTVPFSVRDTVANYTADMIIITASKATLTNILQAISFADKKSAVMTFGAKAFVDRRGYSLQSAVKIPCVQLLADNVPPVLTAFALNLGLGTVTLTMSKPVQINLVNLGFIALASSGDSNPARKIVLSGASVLTSRFAPSSTITISLNSGPYPTVRDQINLGSDIGTSVQSTFIVINKGFVGDTTVPPNYLNPSSRAADVLVQDTIKPKLLSWQLDFDRRVLAVTYDEAVLPTTNIATSYLLLQNPAVVTQYEFFLSPSSYTDTSVQGNTVVMHLSLADCNTIFRMTPGLCTGSANCFLSIRQNAVSDIKGNLIAAVIHVFATLPPAVFVPDRTPAVLTNYTINMQNAVADFYFDKVVDCLSADMSKFIWQYAAFLGFCETCEYYVMAHSSPTCSGDSILRYDTRFRLNIQLADFVPMKAATRLLKSRAFTFVRPTPGFVLDTFGNPTAAVQDGSGFGPRQPDGYVGDTVRPLLLSFTISSAKVLYLQFNEPVRTAALDITKATFLDVRWPGTKKSYPLAAAMLTAFDANRTQLQLAFGSDFSRMADNSRVLSLQKYTLLSIKEGFITDTSGNAIVAISNRTALQYGPSVVAWDINLVTGQISLFFPEGMEIFAPAGLGVQSVADTSASAAANQTYILTTVANATAIDSTATGWRVTLSAVDLNGIKHTQPGFSQLYLTVPFSLARSVYVGALLSHLSVVERPSSDALLARILMPDTQAPKILSFHFNYNTGMLYILFDEPIKTSTFQTAGITVVSSQVGSYATLTAASASNLTSFNITTIAITLCRADLILVKLAVRMGPLDSLIVGPGALSDLAGNAFGGNTQETPISATASTPDTTPPVLQAVVLDMLQGVMTLAFDELLTSSSVLPTNFAVAASADYSSTKYVLTNATTVDRDSSGNVFLNLKTFEVDFMAVEALAALGTATSNTFIHFSGVADIFGNRLTTRRVLQATRVIPDTRNFTIKAFDHDAASKTFTFYLSRAAITSAFKCADFTLLSAASASPAVSASFSASSCTIVGSANSTVVSFIYSPGTPIDATFSAVATTYLCNPAVGASRDVGGRLLAPRTAAHALRVGPQIENALLDLDKGVVTLIFSKAVNLLSLDPSKMGFYSAVSGGSTFLLSTTATALKPTSFVSASTTVDNKGTFALSVADVNLIKALDPQPGQLYLISTEIGTAGLIKDSAGVRSAPLSVAAGNAKLVSKLTMDTAVPVLERITASIGTNLLALVFSEPIRPASVIVGNFLLQSSASSTAGSYRLTGGSVTASGVFVNITLTTFDSERIKLTRGLFKSQDSSFLSMAFKTAADFAGNYLQPQSASAARALDLFIPDTVPPLLLTYEVDMTLALLTLRFSEPVRAASLALPVVQLQSRLLARDGVAYTLTGGALRSNDSSTLVVALSAADVTAIKTTNGLLRGTSSTYMVLQSSLALDIAGNAVVNIPDGRAQLVSVFTTDSINPSISSIVMNANLGTISFFFSEPVQSNAVTARAVTMFSAGTTDKARKSVALSASTVADNSLIFTSVLTLLLSPTDLNTLKYRAPIMRNASSSWFAVSQDFALDVFFNPNAPVAIAAAVSFIPDTTPPQVVGYTFDMQLGVISLSISESVLAASFAPSQFTMQTQAVRRFGSAAVIGDSVVTIGVDAASAFVSLQLSPATLSLLKFNRIGTAPANALLSWTDKAFTDQVGNYVPPLWDGSIAGNAPLAPSDIRPDEISPILQRWQVDRTTMTLYLYFDEPVVLLNASKIFIYADALGAAPQSLGAVLQTSVSAALNTQIAATLRDACAFAAPGRSCAPLLVTSPAGATSTQPPANNFFLTLLRTPTTPEPFFFLGMQAGALRDFAAVPNYNNPIVAGDLKGLLPETPPNCGPCPSGQYTSKVCSAIADRVCASCSSCTAGTWRAAKCSSEGNTVCKVCSPCQFGTYVSTPCLPASDAVCSPCSSCPPGQYQSQTCSLGRNVICASCLMCDFPSADMQARCDSAAVFNWQQTNCCKDENGNTQSCYNVGASNMLITVIKGKHREGLPKSNSVLPKP